MQLDIHNQVSRGSKVRMSDSEAIVHHQTEHRTQEAQMSKSISSQEQDNNFFYRLYSSAETCIAPNQ